MRVREDTAQPSVAAEIVTELVGEARAKLLNGEVPEEWSAARSSVVA